MGNLPPGISHIGSAPPVVESERLLSRDSGRWAECRKVISPCKRYRDEMQEAYDARPPFFRPVALRSILARNAAACKRSSSRCLGTIMVFGITVQGLQGISPFFSTTPGGVRALCRRAVGPSVAVFVESGAHFGQKLRSRFGRFAHFG